MRRLKKGTVMARRLETRTLKRIKKNNIVACGGGLPFYNNNMYFIIKSAFDSTLKMFIIK